MCADKARLLRSTARRSEKTRNCHHASLSRKVAAFTMRYSLAVLFSTFSFGTLALAAEPRTKKLIEFGWDEPGTSFMREHISEMEHAPFDGVVFDAEARKPNGYKYRFTWDGWGTNQIEEVDLQRAVEDLRATKFQRFTDNFFRFNTTPAKLDWFDDHATVIHNCRVAAWFAKQGGVKGLLFDIEQYDGQLFDYRKQRDAKTKSWEVYAQKIRERGREVMNAFQDGYPDATIFLTFGYSLPWNESQQGKRPLAECHYGLLAPFLDGMLDVAKGKTLIVDGNENAYRFRDTNRFATSYRAMKQELLPIVQADKNVYARHFSLGFGLWMDCDWRKVGWGINDFSTNFYSPEAFEKSVRAALQTADDYVWVYTEQPRWWSAEGRTVKLPDAYEQAVRRARQGVAKD
jgi:hypothetical protein